METTIIPSCTFSYVFLEYYQCASSSIMSLISTRQYNVVFISLLHTIYVSTIFINHPPYELSSQRVHVWTTCTLPSSYFEKLSFFELYLPCISIHLHCTPSCKSYKNTHFDFTKVQENIKLIATHIICRPKNKEEIMVEQSYGYVGTQKLRN